jgi:C-terminal processing protease CtpA/Prc
MLRMALSRLAAFVCVVGALAAQAAPTGKPDAPDRSERLLGLARVWAEAKFFHPAMFQRAIDWDGALVRAIPEVEAATDAQSYRAAVERLLAAIGDPETKVLEPRADGAPPSPWKEWAPQGVLVLHARPPSEHYMAVKPERLLADVRADLEHAKVLVADLRGAYAVDDRMLSALLDQLPATPTWPMVKEIRHDGYRSQGETNRNAFPTSWQITSGGAPTPGATHGPSHVVFIVDRTHAPPPTAVALWASGHASLVSAHPLDGAPAITSTVDLPYGLAAQIRVAELVLSQQRAVAADVVVARPAELAASAIATAGAIAAGHPPPRARVSTRANPDELRVADDDDSPEAALPSRERRLLAAMRVWAVIEYFHGVRRLDHDWDKQLQLAVPRLDAATDFETYIDLLNEMLASLDDAHTGVYAVAERQMRAATAVYWRRIEGKIVAGGFRDEAQAKAAGIALGDELVSVDGVPAEEKVARKLRITSGGTDEGRRQWTVATLDRAARGTTVNDEIRGADGKVRRVELQRAFGYEDNFWGRSGPHFRVLTGDIGYVDLARLTIAEVEAMFEALGKTRAIVFDMRGYPNGTGGVIAQRLNTRRAAAMAEFRTPILTGRRHGADVTTRWMQRVPATAKTLYRGKVVVLIDDRAVSAAEHTCLFFEAAAGAIFVGTPTSGTDGEETYERLPGGVEMRFTGQEVLHVDGRQLQQVGIQPNIRVSPTLRGLRAGKDEVLDRALRYLQTGK